MSGAVAPPGGHILAKPSRFQLQKGSKRQDAHLCENPPALWMGGWKGNRQTHAA